MNLCVRRLNHQTATLLPCLRKKPDVLRVEQLSERAAALWHLGQELNNNVPIKESVLKKEWYEAWANGCNHIDVELQAILLEKRDDFEVTKNVPMFKRIVEEHIMTAPVNMDCTTQEKIEVDQFELFMTQLRYDCQVYGVWERKCATAMAARRHAELEFKLSQREKCKKAARNFLAAFTRILVWESNKVENIIAELMNFKRVICQRADHDDLSQLLFWNMASPALVTAESQIKQNGVLTWALHANAQSCCLLTLPQFTYKKGLLWMEEKKLVEMITAGNHNIDLGYSILFTGQNDQRDQRPMVYHGKFVFASPIGDPRKTLFGNAEMVRLRRTEPVQQLPPNKMREVEDLTPNALPPSTDSRDGPKGASKYAQLGPDALEKMIKGMLTGGPGFLDNVGAILLVDLAPVSLESLEAFMAVRGLFSPALYYTCIAQDELERNWQTNMAEEWLIDKYASGDVQLPGGDKLQSEISNDLLEPFPPPPQLNQLVITGSEGEKQLKIPVALVKTWSLHPKFGKEFSAWLDTFLATHGVQDDAPTVPETPNKRKGLQENTDGDPSSAKKPKKISSACLVETSSISEPLLAEVKLPNRCMPKDTLWLQLRASHNVYLTNKAKNEVTVAQWFHLGCFGKGSFKLVREEGQNAAGLLECRWKSDEDLVVLNGTVLSLGKVFNDQRKSKPDAVICYHKMTLNQDIEQ